MLIGYFNTLFSDFDRLTTKNKGIENSSKIINKVGLICFYPVENTASHTFMKKMNHAMDEKLSQDIPN